MADILLICVSKDAPRTRALAERFEKAGLSVGDVFSPDPALHSAAAGVLVWSENSHHSLFFRDAASRLFRAGAAVVAALTNVPPPTCFGASLNFDLSRWRGDPCDPALDPLVAAIQQMVVRDLCTQAECWRSIRDSRDPLPLLDYLARYGPDGAFSTLAEKRLKRLAPTPRPQRQAPTTALVLAPAADKAPTLDQRSPASPAAAPLRPKAASAPSHTNSASSPAQPAATPVRRSPALPPSNANPMPPTNGADTHTPNPGDAPVAQGRRVRMTFPLLIGAVFVGLAYFGALGVSKYVFAPSESLAAPTDAPVLLLNETAPAHISAEPWFEPAPDQPAYRTEQATPVLSDKLQSIPHMASSESGEPSAALTLLDAPTMAPLEGAPDLAATPTEAVEQWGASSDDNVDAPLVPEPRATAPMDGAASDEPRAAYVEPNMVESGYGPQS